MEDQEDPAAAGDEVDGKYRKLQDTFADVEIGALPIGPDGGIASDMLGPIGVSPSVPAAAPERFICLRGPCRHYWARETFFGSGNPEETWGEDGLRDPDGNPIRQPRQIDRTCTAHPGTETELTDELVYDCTKWSPLSPRELRRIAKQRRAYYKRHPDHDPSFVPAGHLARRD